MMCDDGVTRRRHPNADPNAKRARSDVPARIVVRTLGVVAIDIGDRRIGPSSGRLFALLLYLASRRGHPTSRRVVQELLFPEATDAQGSHNLRQLLYRLRQIGAPIESDADQIRISAEEFVVDW